MHSKMLRKCRRIAAITLASAMIFGSMTVMAEGESIQTAEQETVVTDNEAAASSEEKTTATEEAVVSSEEEITAEKVAAATVEEDTVVEEAAVAAVEEETTLQAEEPKEDPIFAPNVASWNGKDSISFTVDTKGGAITEFSYNVYTTSSEDPYGGIYVWMNHIEGNIDKESGVGEGNILFTDTLAAFCENNKIDEKEVEKIEFFFVVSYDGSEKVVRKVTLPVELADVDWEKGEYRLANGKTYYLLDMKLGNGVLGYAPNWSGPEDVREVVKDGKTYYFVLPNSEYPLHYTFTIDEKYKDMNNSLVMKDGYEIQVKLVSGEGKAEPVGNGVPDWVIKFTASKATTFEVSVVEEGAGELEETTTITDNSGKSGVSMQLPTDAPEGLSLKVSESNGSEEKEAVSKLVQVEGDKIKTFDLSLLMDGKVWEYDGQFKSKVTLPVPEGWNLDLLGLYYFDEAANKATAVPFTVDKENGTITFETDHFSRFVLVEKVAEQADADGTDANGTDAKTSPKTGDAANVTLYMILLLVAGTAVVAFERKRRA